MSDSTPTDAGVKIDPEKTHVILEHAFPRPLTACYWEPQNRYILLGSEEYGIYRFHIETKEMVPLVGPHDSWVRAIGTSPDGQVTYTGGYDGRLVWWQTDADKPEPIRVVDDAHQGWLRALVVSPDGTRIATCGNDLLVRLWDSQSGELLQSFAGHEWHVYNVAFSPAGDLLASCDLRGFVKVWNPNPSDEAAPAAEEPGEEKKTPGLIRDLSQVESLYIYDKSFRADIGGARCMEFSADGTRLALGGVTKVTNAFAGVGDLTVVLVDMEAGEVAVELGPKEKIRGTAWGVAQHPDKFWIGLAGGGGGGWFYFWKDDSAEEFFKLKLKAEGRGMGMSPDRSQVAVAHPDKQLRIYGLYAEEKASE
ncbi:MAG: hypothetical protein WDZ51_06470 [Pirellulaceae bacterium]